MSSALTELEPRHIWGFFDDIRQIPRPSKHEEKIQAHLKAWAEEQGFPVVQDATGNLVVSVPASPGHEDTETVVLQGHVDMVPEKNSGTDHDFLTDPIQAEVDGDWVTARETTLGADNGIGVAMAMAAATDPEVVHGPLELLFTVDEETGLTGARDLDPGLLTGRMLLNLDTEEDGAFYIGCAGGQDLHTTFAREAKSSSFDTGFTVAVKGLRGGHSGVDIHENRANAVKLLARLLTAFEAAGIAYDLFSIDAGSKHNAIPREAFATLTTAAGSEDAMRTVIAEQKEEFLGEFSRIDPNLAIELNPADPAGEAFSDDLRRRLVGAIVTAPHGVMAMSRDVPGLVETSNNVAVVKTEADRIDITTSTRSSVMPALRAAVLQVRRGFEMAGAAAEEFGGYPGWTPNPDSRLLLTGREVFETIFAKEPDVKAIHAGLECGIIGEKFPGMDMISFGPEIRSPHAPGEKVQISSVAKSWKLLKNYLAALV